MNAEFLIYGLIFIGVLVLVEGLYLVAFGKSISLNSRVNRRLEMLEKGTRREEVLEKLRKEMEQHMSAKTIPLYSLLSEKAQKAAIAFTPKQLLMIMAGVSAGAFMALTVGTATEAPVRALLSVGIGVGAVYFWISSKANKRMGLIEEQLPDAEDLILAFTTKGGRLSRGTAKTMVENSDKGHLIRKNGKLEQFPLGRLIRKVDYGGFTQLSVGISWGDISTAYYSTKIPNITVFTGADKKQLKSLKMAHRLRGLLKLGFVKRFLQKQIDKKPPGPSEESRKRSETYLWGKAIKKEKSVECRLKVPNGYDLTASAVLLITQKILHGNFKPGFQTPATAYGKDLIFEIEGCELIP